MGNLEPITILRNKLYGKTQAAVAEELGITPSYLHDILTGRRAIGPAVLMALGLEKVVTYRRKNGK